MERKSILTHMRAIEGRFNAEGLTLYVCTDPQELPALLEDVGKKRVHPMSEVSDDDLESGRAFWLFLKREDRCITCISAKSVDLGGKDFGNYFRGLAASRYGGRDEVVASVSQPLVDELRGRLIYFGGIEVAPDERGGIRRLGDFAQYVKLLAATRWDFDWMYTIIAYKHRRLADDYGFNGKYRNAICWSDPVPEGLANDQMILGLNAVHFSHIVSSVEPGNL
ncbi:hypothetical protein [Leisingera caerulea]|uniref:Uncharacterized protein n=1 Tax=Leisingera caerulea TaxID=506591 RepID=A0A9Q9HQ90_LEICA|nr:hypothetical protein [Leisingera caerulea]UWQ56305.1 hypothetical protein K3721_20105 [Leisingera caerulea]UWQ65009.1 hypothetical protein K3723_19555 [Leisingera caerulea]UWQ85777.1 hypothetical protein K3726_20195 [Leisingera caerulea]